MLLSRRTSFLLPFLLLLISFHLDTLAAEVVTYPAPPGTNASADYAVRVNGQEVFTYQVPVASIAYFSTDGPVEIEITPRVDVKWVDIRPKRLAVVPSLANNVIRFTLEQPANISIELNGRIEQPLFIFANPLEIDRPSPGDPLVHFYEGGKVHEAGLVEIKSNETVYIEGGAIVRGAFVTRNAENVTIRGRGMIDGSVINDLHEQQVPVSHLLSLQDAVGIDLEGIILVDSYAWNVVPVRSRDIRMNNIKIVSGNASDDGIDLVRSQNITIENVFVRTKDDCIAIKTHTDDPQNRGTTDVMVRNSVFWNAEWGNGFEIGFELRSPVVRNIVFLDNDFIHVESGAVLSIHNADSATVHDIRFEDLRIEDARQKLFDLAIFYSRFSVDGPKTEEELTRRYLHGAWDNVMKFAPEEREEIAKYRGHVRDVVFKNVYILEGPLPYSIFNGFDENHLVENVLIDGLWVGGRKIERLEEARFYIEHARNIRFANPRADYILPNTR